jgi:hypothetical protein
MSKSRLLSVIVFIAIGLLSACNMPGRRTPTPSGFEMINTAAARTVAAQLTEISRPPVATSAPTSTLPGSTPVAPATPQATAQTTLVPAFTQVPAPTQAPQASACDRARFVRDVTVPDNTVMQPGERFTKTWRMKNVGSCTWDSDYALVFVSGNPLGAPGVVPLTQEVGPDDTVDISVEMIAPEDGGTFRSEWKLSNRAKQIFGTGQEGDLPIWAQIRVNTAQSSSSGMQYDFVSSASSADWYSTVSEGAGTPLAFNGSPDDPAGAAILADGLKLETNQTSGKVLLVVPRQEQNGAVYGIFPAYKVQAGDRFNARVGFAANPDGRCGKGKAIFQLAVQIDEDTTTLKEIAAACDGSLTPVDVDLNSLRGQTTSFILVVRADGSPQDDWAVWNSPQIVNK